MKAEDWKPSDRIAIVFDGEKWFVRRIDCTVRDWETDEVVYHCDKPIVNDAETLGEAVLKAMVEEARTATSPETGS